METQKIIIELEEVSKILKEEIARIEQVILELRGGGGGISKVEDEVTRHPQ